MLTSEQIEVELRDTICFCGRGKGIRRPFCAGCYRSLPKGQQNALYRTGKAFETAFKASRKYISDRLYK